MKKCYLTIVLLIVVCLFSSQVAYAHGVIFETKQIGKDKIRISLKWSNPKEAKGFVISGYYTENSKILNIGYRIENKAGKTATIDYSLAAAIPPISIILFKSDDINWLPFKDIKGIEAEKYIRNLHDGGIVDAGSDGKFRPNANITRAEFAEMICKALKLSGTVINTKGLTDISKTPQKKYILLAVQKGFLTGYKDKTFRPKNPVTVAEMCTSISKAFTFKTVRNGIYTKLKKDKPYTAVVKKIFDVGILNVKDSIYLKFNEDSKISRANASIMLSRALSTY